MAIITFNRTANDKSGFIAGTVTSSTAKIIKNYIERRKLDVQTIVQKEFGYEPSYNKR